MKQLEVEIIGLGTDKPRLLKVVSLHWSYGKLYSIEVDVYGTGRDTMWMHKKVSTDKIFYNNHGNITGKLK